MQLELRACDNADHALYTVELDTSLPSRSFTQAVGFKSKCVAVAMKTHMLLLSMEKSCDVNVLITYTKCLKFLTLNHCLSGSVTIIMPSYKFTYFDARGRGELCRYILHAAGQKFVDERFTFEQWPEHKAGKTYNIDVLHCSWLRLNGYTSKVFPWEARVESLKPS